MVEIDHSKVLSKKGFLTRTGKGYLLVDNRIYQWENGMYMYIYLHQW